MSKDVVAAEPVNGKMIGAADHRDFVSVTIADQLFGIPVLQVQDVLGTQRITRIPLAPAEVAGSLNLRGRIVTAIDIRVRLRLPPRTEGKQAMSVVVDHGGELYSLLVDSVGEVLSLEPTELAAPPGALPERWADSVRAVCQLERELLLILDAPTLLQPRPAEVEV